MESDPELPVARRVVVSGQLARLPDYLRHIAARFRIKTRLPDCLRQIAAVARGITKDLKSVHGKDTAKIASLINAKVPRMDALCADLGTQIDTIRAMHNARPEIVALLEKVKTLPSPKRQKTRA